MDAPIREDWVFGAEGLSKVAGLVFQMQGTLGIESNAAQPLYLNRAVTVGDVKAYVQTAPSQISALSQIPANTAVSIGITAVGSTFPGADLWVFIYS